MGEAFSKELREYVAAKVASGEYGSDDEVFATAVEVMKKWEDLKAAVDAGIESGAPLPEAEVFARLKARHEGRIICG